MNFTDLNASVINTGLLVLLNCVATLAVWILRDMKRQVERLEHKLDDHVRDHLRGRA